METMTNCREEKRAAARRFHHLLPTNRSAESLSHDGGKEEHCGHAHSPRTPCLFTSSPSCDWLFDLKEGQEICLPCLCCCTHDHSHKNKTHFLHLNREIQSDYFVQTSSTETSERQMDNRTEAILVSQLVSLLAVRLSQSWTLSGQTDLSLSRSFCSVLTNPEVPH